jgi:YidC/Oxa1 family membrane protein insertase
MEFDRKTVLAFLLIGVILILVNTEFYQRLMFGDLPQKPSPVARTAAQPDSMRARTSVIDSLRIVESSEDAEPRQADKAQVDFLNERRQEKQIRVETPLYSGTFSTLGASLKKWQFKSYLGPDDEFVTFFQDGEKNLAVRLPTVEDTLDTGGLNFEWENAVELFGDAINLESGQTTELVFKREMAPGKYIRKTYSLSGDEYTIRLKVEFVNLQDLMQGYSYLLSWQTGLESTEENVSEDMSYAKAHANELEDGFDIGSKIYDVSRIDGTTTWAAIRTKYFAVAMIPEGAAGTGVRFTGRSFKTAKDVSHKAYQMDLAMPLYREGQSGHAFSVYIGPLDYDIVKGFGVGLERMMNLGWRIIQPFSILVLKTFTFLHKFIPNYGLVIIIFSILVKVVLHPLTKKSYQSMREMQELQPKMAEIREKYAKDAQRMNAEMMKLYKEHGVNPLGGCLPMLLQMPLLYALFIVFRSTIELRHANFVWWIKDLSAPDTIFKLPFSIPLYGDLVNVLPIVMGATMLIQQAMTMKDPKQKFLVYFMPIFFALIFNSFPSGLNLYYTLFNLFSILQQKYLTTAPAQVKKAKKQKSYRQFVADWRRGGVNALLSQKRLKKR